MLRLGSLPPPEPGRFQSASAPAHG
jgi:hypothetical protein